MESAGPCPEPARPGAVGGNMARCGDLRSMRPLRGFTGNTYAFHECALCLGRVLWKTDGGGDVSHRHGWRFQPGLTQRKALHDYRRHS